MFQIYYIRLKHPSDLFHINYTQNKGSVLKLNDSNIVLWKYLTYKII